MGNKSVKETDVSVSLGNILGLLSAGLFRKGKENSLGSRSKEAIEKAVLSPYTVFSRLKKGSGNSRKKEELTVANFVTGALFGLLVGAGSALFFSPKKGKQLRKNLSQSYQSFSGKAQDFIDNLKKNPGTVKKAPKKAAKKRTTVKNSKAVEKKKTRNKTQLSVE